MNKIESSLAQEGHERRLAGLAVGPGIAVGPVFGTLEAPAAITRQRIVAADIEAERSRLDIAVAASRKQLGKLRARLHVLPEDTQAEIAPLLDAYVQMLGSSRLLRGARKRIAEALRSAEQAVTDEADAISAALLAASPDDLPAGQRRADEVQEIAKRLVRNLTRAPFRSFTGLPAGAILVAEWLTPADAALIDPARVAGRGHGGRRRGWPYRDHAAGAWHPHRARRARADGACPPRGAGHRGRVRRRGGA